MTELFKKPPFFQKLHPDVPLYVYTDGACKGNPGPGGWGVYIVQGPESFEMGGGSISTTNNRMELMAIIEALKLIPNNFKINIFSDSQYCVKGITEWMKGWKEKGWVTSNKKPVLNKELWLELDKLIQNHNIEWQWVKGHAENAGNIKADELAVSYIPKAENPNRNSVGKYLKGSNSKKIA